MQKRKGKLVHKKGKMKIYETRVASTIPGVGERIQPAKPKGTFKPSYGNMSKFGGKGWGP